MTTLSAGRLFARWLWMVYLPIGVFAVGLILLAGGALSPWILAPLVAIGAWAALAIRLLLERRRKRVSVAAPKGLVAMVVWTLALATAGAIFGWMGMERISSEGGTALALLGGFLLLLAATAPLFKLLDYLVRAIARGAGGRRRPKQPVRATERSERVVIPEPITSPEPSPRWGVVSSADEVQRGTHLRQTRTAEPYRHTQEPVRKKAL